MGILYEMVLKSRKVIKKNHKKEKTIKRDMTVLDSKVVNEYLRYDWKGYDSWNVRVK